MCVCCVTVGWPDTPALGWRPVECNNHRYCLQGGVATWPPCATPRVAAFVTMHRTHTHTHPLPLPSWFPPILLIILQATRPQLTRWLDSVGSVWSKAVIGATLATAVVLPLLGVPFLGDRGALYRAMGVLTAGAYYIPLWGSVHRAKCTRAVSLCHFGCASKP